jgi:hypothetical protein
MTKLLAVCLIAMFVAMFASFAIQKSARENQALRLVQTIPLPGVKGRLDHMAVDLEKKRLFVAAVANNSLEVVDLTGGKVIKSLAGMKNTQDALFLGGDFNKLYVASLDGHLRVFQGESFWLVQDFKIEPDPNRLFYDPTTNLIYFGYGGQNAGFDAYERVGILQPKRGAGYDQLVADMIAPTPRPGHLAEIAMDDNGTLLICDSRADLIYQFDTRKRELVKSWPASGDGAGDMALNRTQHRLFVGTRIRPEMTVYDSLSGREIQSLPGPETMDGVYYDAKLKRVYMTGGALVRDTGSIIRLGLRLPAEGPRPLRCDLQDQDQTRFGHFALSTPTQSLLCSVSGNRRSRSRNTGICAGAMMILG